MTRKLVFLFALSLIFTVSTAFAQQRSKNFLGTWKLAETGNDSVKKRGTESMTINVTEDGDFLVVEKIGKGTDNIYSSTTKTNFKINGNPITTVSGGFLRGFESRRLRFEKDNKLQFLMSTYYDLDRRLTREIWTVSKDGKTLTVKHAGRYAWSKMIFTKE